MENKTLFFTAKSQLCIAARAFQGCNWSYRIPGLTWNEEERFTENELYCFANELPLPHGNLLRKTIFAFFA